MSEALNRDLSVRPEKLMLLISSVLSKLFDQFLVAIRNWLPTSWLLPSNSMHLTCSFKLIRLDQKNTGPEANLVGDLWMTRKHLTGSCTHGFCNVWDSTTSTGDYSKSLEKRANIVSG